MERGSVIRIIKNIFGTVAFAGLLAAQSVLAANELVRGNAPTAEGQKVGASPILYLANLFVVEALTRVCAPPIRSARRAVIASTATWFLTMATQASADTACREDRGDLLIEPRLIQVGEQPACALARQPGGDRCADAIGRAVTTAAWLVMFRSIASVAQILRPACAQ